MLHARSSDADSPSLSRDRREPSKDVASPEAKLSQCSMALVDLLGGGRALDPLYSQKYLQLDRILQLSVAEMEEMLASW
eukprot:3934729-Rhodomonas_salina.1